jgi:hypothetical protein
LRAATHRRFRCSSVDSPSFSPQAPSPASEEEGDWLNRRRIGFPLFTGSYIVGLGFPVEPVSWPPVLLILWSAVGRCGGGRSGAIVGKAEAPSFGDGPGRIRCDFVRSGVLVSPLELGGSLVVPPSYPSALTAVMVDSPAGSSGGMFYQPRKLDWSLDPTSSGGFLSLLGLSLSGKLGLSMVEVSDILFSGDVMALGHLVRPARSASKVCVGVAGVPLKICVSSSGGWSASMRLSRPSATRTTGRSLQGRGCNFYAFQGCLCKCWNVNHHNYV